MKPIAPVALLSFALFALSACSKPAPEGGSTSEASTTDAPAADAAPVAYASLTGDAAKGKTLFARCASCHSVEPGKNGLGPTLHKIVGSKAGEVPGFNFSPAMKQSGITWDEEKLFTYLENPRVVVPGTKMAYAGLKPAQERADLIAYLKTLQ